MSFAFEIFALQIIYQVVSFKKIRRTNLPQQVLQVINRRLNSIKSYEEEAGLDSARDIIFLNASVLIMLNCKSMLHLINTDQFVELANKMVRSEEEASYHKPIINLLAILLDERSAVVDDKMRIMIKERFNVLYMDILSVNIDKIQDDLWIGTHHNPLELTNYIEYWIEAVMKDQQVMFPIFPKAAVQLKI